ncbi:hypothetical protein CCP1ISM_1700002 [Azospirillaceae bacterium]
MEEPPSELAPPVATSPPSDALPDTLPPFNLAAALERMGGRHSLVRKVITGFYTGFSTSSAELERLAAASRWEELLRLAHTLKGIAATLDATTLTEATGALEQTLLHRGDGEIPAEEVRGLLDAVKIELAVALEAAALVVLPTTAPPNAAQPDSARPPVSAPPIDFNEINRLITDLQASLGKRSPKARKALIPLQDALAGRSLDTHLNALSAHLDRYDFPSAQNALSALLADLPSAEASS